MYEWEKQIQVMVDEIDECLKNHGDEELTLRVLSRKLGYSEFHTTRKFREITGMSFRDYLRGRKLAFALKEVRDSEKSLLEIGMDYGFSSNEAFTRAFRKSYGVTPSQYRKNPKPVVLRTKISPFDRYFLGLGEIGMVKSADGIKIYFVTIRADVLRAPSRAPVPLRGEPREQRLLGFLAEAKPHSGAGLRDDLRSAGQHEGKAGRQRRKRGQRPERSDHGLYQ